VQGWDPTRVEDILFENVRVELDKWSKVSGGEHDIRPAPVTGVYPYPTAGFFIKNARDVRLRNCEVVWGENRPDYFRHALETHHVDGLVLDNFKGEAAHPQRDPAVFHV
ncbi:MAG: glycoside hydrolase, partial [Anaerolineae bacterium]|nr:glycoside hydrolase [Anaerolineae bacterium]